MADTSSVPRSFCVLTEPVVYLLLFLVLFSPVLNAQTTASWNGGNGNWSNAKDWTPNGAPENGGGNFFNAVINGTRLDTITFDSSGTIINSLSLGLGETLQDNGHLPTLTIGDPAFSAAGSLTNGGTINWRNGSTLILDITAGNGSITSSGVINLTSSTLKINDSGKGNMAVLSGGGTVNLSGALITGAFGDETLTNSSNIIQGLGTIRNLTLVNNALIKANASAPLSITPGSGGFTNNGTVNATGPGGLRINTLSGALTNNGIVDINNSTLNVKGDFGLNQGTVTLQNGSVGTVSGTFNDVSNGSEATVIVDHSSLSIKGDYSDGSYLGYSTPTLSVANGGTLKIGGNYNGNNYSIVSITDSSATVRGSFNTGQTLNVGNSVLSVGRDFNSALFGSFATIDGSTLLVNGSVNLSGDSTLSLGGSTARVSGDLFNDFSTLIVAGSTLVVKGSEVSNDEGFNFVEGGGHLIVNGSYGIDVGGNMGFSFLDLIGSGNTASLNSVTNGGTVQVDAGSVLTVNRGGFANIPLFPAGTVGTVNLAGTMTVKGGFTNNGGSVILAPTGTLATDTYAQSGGLTDVSGTLVANSYRQNAGTTIIETGGLLSSTTFNATGGTTSITGKSVANILGTLSNIESNFTVDNSVLNVRGDMVNEFFGNAILQNDSIGAVGGSLFNGGKADMVIDESVLTVRGNVLNAGFGGLTIENAATLNVLGNFTITGISSGATLVGGSTVNVAGTTFINGLGDGLFMGGTNDVLNARGGFMNSGGNVSIFSGAALSTSNYSQSSGLTDVAGNLTSHSYSQAGGNTTVETGGVLSTTTFTTTGGTVTVNGTLDPTAVEIGSRGTLQGGGIINGNVFNRGNIIAGTPGNPLTFDINGNYTQNATGIFTELIGSKGNGLLNISGAATLLPGASINVQLVGGFDPKNGTSFTIMDYGSQKGTFTISDPYFDNGKQKWVVSSYGGGDGHDVLLTAEASNVVTPEPSTMLLVGTVLLGMGGYAKKKRASSAAH